MHAAYVRPGGVHQDLPQDLIDDIEHFCDDAPEGAGRHRGPADQQPHLQAAQRRYRRCDLEECFAWGFSGVMVRGSGAAWDLRKSQPYECYSELDFDIPVGKNGDCYDRYLIRMEEMRQSVKIMQQCIALLNAPEGKGPVSSLTARSCRPSAAR
jgi:NADH-quinone oxidoreductase subunit D